jgi:hypothetical protein
MCLEPSRTISENREPMLEHELQYSATGMPTYVHRV